MPGLLLPLPRNASRRPEALFWPSERKAQRDREACHTNREASSLRTRRGTGKELLVVPPVSEEARKR